MKDFPLNIDTRLEQFEAVNLEQLSKVRLMDRQDTKFIFNIHQLEHVLERLRARFHVLEIDARRIFQYDTRYLDSSGLDLYLQHHNGRRPRFKVRYRKYHAPETVYFEIKIKDSRNRTTKYRIQVPTLGERASAEEVRFARQYLRHEIGGFTPSLDVSFNRITLVNKSEPDRITIDLALRTRHEEGFRSFEDLVIAEIKQPQYRPSSVFIQTMRAADIPEMRLSKYCLGILNTHRGVKYNRFKPKLLRLNQILHSKENTEILYA